VELQARIAEPASAQRSRARRRAVAVVTVGLALIASVTVWLATTGVATTSISPPAGAPSSGDVANVTSMSSTVTRTNGAAQLQTGVALAKLALAKSNSTGLRVDIAWTNANHTARVLSNPNVQISIGVYHTVHAGNCKSTAQSVDAPLVNLTDTDSATYCAALDQGATGRFVSSTGKLLLAQNQVDGFLLPALDGSDTLDSCASSGGDTDVWCQPASVTDPNQRALFLIASIVTPGGIPEGQQPDLNSLDFFIGVRRQG
jgi:hypothetical protein